MTMAQQETRDNYKQFYPITTRWMDNDYYGHVNNVAYYSYFDTAANQYLIEQGEVDLKNAKVIGVVVNSSCTYKSSVAYPQRLEAGLRVDRLGNSSVQYGLAIFAEGETIASAYGHFVHVFVDRKTSQSVPIPQPLEPHWSAWLRSVFNSCTTDRLGRSGVSVLAIRISPVKRPRTACTTAPKAAASTVRA